MWELPQEALTQGPGPPALCVEALGTVPQGIRLMAATPSCKGLLHTLGVLCTLDLLATVAAAAAHDRNCTGLPAR